MTVERHYDDESLIALLENNRLAADIHIPACSPCAEKVESFRMVADILREADTWDSREVTDGVPETIHALRAFAGQMASEDERAVAIVAELLDGVRESWMRKLQQHPEWRTAGVVRRLIEKAYDAVMQMPPDAVEMMALATDIADHIDPDSYASDTVAHLRAAAWRDSAYALYYTGRFVDALAATKRAAKNLDLCLVDEYERARLGIVEALILRAFEKFEDASRVAATSTHSLLAFGDLSRVASSRIAEAQMLFSRGDYATAEPRLLDLERQMAKSQDVDTHARVLANLAFCSGKLGKVEAALQFYATASAFLNETGATTDVLRIKWTIAVMLAETGRPEDACLRIRELTPEMERLGMTSEAAIAGLDVAECLLAQGRYAEIEEICGAAMRSFERAGLAYSTRALTALAFIREAAALRRADQALVRTVRDYIRRLPSQPNLLFALPPE